MSFCAHRLSFEQEEWFNCPSLAPIRALSGSLEHYCASVRVCLCVSVRSINAWASNSILNGGSTHVTSRLRPESSPVQFSGGPSGVGRLYFSSSPVRSVVAHSLPARFEILIVRARICMTVLFQCKLWLCRLFSFCTVQSPAHHQAYRDARSRDRERGLSKLHEWCRCTCLLRDPIGSFSDCSCGSPTAQRGPTAERPCFHKLSQCRLFLIDCDILNPCWSKVCFGVCLLSHTTTPGLLLATLLPTSTAFLTMKKEKHSLPSTR